MVGWALIVVGLVLIIIGDVRHWRDPYLPPGKYPTYFNRRVRGRRRR
jgi:hypothetical protein